MKSIAFISILVGFSLAQPLSGRQLSVPRPALSFADIADLTTGAPLVAKARISGVKSVKGGAADVTTPAKKYQLITVKVESLIRGQGGIAPRVSFLALANAQRFGNGARVLLYARPGQKSGQVQLVSANAMQPWSPELEATTRAVTTELLGARSIPAIIAVGDAFHVPGTVQGESETQIFLKTATGEPVSLSIVHRAGEATRWGVSLGEIVDDAAVPPAPGTLLWYRLACALPATLPDSATRALAVLDAEAARRDYSFVMESLGSCGRTL